MDLNKTGQAPQTLPSKPARVCTHRRLISDCVSEEEHEAGMVRCVECGAIVPDPHFKREGKVT